MTNIYSEVMEIVRQEKTEIGAQAYEVLDREGICNIVKSDGVFWFEYYVSGNDCPQKIYDYLVKLIKRKMKLDYLYEIK